jgi:peptide/nickel transport system substrate-binding protein
LVLFFKKEQTRKHFFFEKKKQKTFALLCLLFATAAAPCGTAVIPDGIGVSDPAAPAGLNPLLAQDTYTLQVATLLYRPLVWIGRDMGFDHARSLADSVEALDGNTRFRVVLKPWRWSDGAAVTADDVKFGWERIEKLGDLFGAAGQGGIPDRVAAPPHVVDSRTLDFVLKEAVNPDWFILNGLSVVYALPRHAWGDIGGDEMWRRQNDPSLFAVTDGPFRLAELRPDRYFSFVPNSLYGGRQPGLAHLVVVFLEGGGALRALQAGEIDMARVPYALWQRLLSMPGFNFYVLPEALGYGRMVLNQRSARAGFLSDVRVRQALAEAVDQPTIIKLAYHGFGTENHLPVPTDSARWRNPAPAGTAPQIRYDPAAAGSLLAAAGWFLGADGLRRKAGARLALSVLTSADPDGSEMEELQVLQSDLRAVGVDMQVRAENFSQVLQTVNAGGTDWDAANLPWGTPPVPDGSGVWNTGGGNNYGRYSDARMDRLIADTISQPGTAAMFQYQDYFAGQQPGLILPQGKQLVMAADRLHGVEEFSNADGYWNPESLSVDDPVCRGAPPDGPRR